MSVRMEMKIAFFIWSLVDRLWSLVERRTRSKDSNPERIALCRGVIAARPRWARGGATERGQSPDVDAVYPRRRRRAAQRWRSRPGCAHTQVAPGAGAP